MERLRIIIAKKKRVFEKMMNEDPNYKGPLSGSEYYGLWSANTYR